MDVAAVIVEQLDANGALRTFRMQAEPGERLTVAFADEYEEQRSGPFHFLDDRHEHKFQKAFAECKVRKVAGARFNQTEGVFFFQTSWAGIPTERQRLSYYALSLPEFAIPHSVKFIDPRSGREYKKKIGRDDHRNRFVLYLECRSSHGSFDFALEARFNISAEAFFQAEFSDETTTLYGVHLEGYEYMLPHKQQVVVQQFFSKEVTMGDQYNVSGQTGAVGPNAKSENNTYNQVWNQAAAGIDLTALASELSALRGAMRKEAVAVEHDQAIANVGAAENAANNQDGGAALKKLKAAGKWALEMATKVGTTVAAKAIEKAIGL